MSAKTQKKRVSGAKKALYIVLLSVAGLLIAASCVGFVLRTTDSSEKNLEDMRDKAVLYAASDGLVESIALEAEGVKLKELRKLPDFRKMGQNEVNQKVAEAGNAARDEARELYSGADDADTAGIREAVVPLEKALYDYNTLRAEEEAVYADIYTELCESVSDWTDFETGLDDDQLYAGIVGKVPALNEKAHLKSGMLKLVRDMSKSEKTAEDKAIYDQMLAAVKTNITDWEKYIELSDEDLYAQILLLEASVAERADFKSNIIKDVKKFLEDKKNDVIAQPAQESATDVESEITVNYGYFKESEALSALGDIVDEKYEAVFAELIAIIPDLDGLSKKMKNTIQETVVDVVSATFDGFAERYNVYADQKAEEILVGKDKYIMWFAAYASVLLIAGLAILLFALVSIFWKPLTGRFGIPRTIITLFFIYLFFAAELYNIYVPMMVSHILVRVGMYGILALAMLPGIQCGIGLNMGMTLGCISGLLSTIIALQYNMTGYEALAFSCVGGALIAIPLGWAYSLLLNRMKGSEMTISTYVGFSFVSLMCIGWMMLPFTNPKIIWLLSGTGLRVTHSLLGSFAHILDELLAFEIFGIEIPTGLLLFFLLCCGIMWLFSHSKLGVAMTAAGNNPRFAEASGINVNRMRTLGTVLSTMIAAVGIVIYSQAFGYAQLYTAPRQMGFIAASIILIGGATVSRAKVSHVVIGVFLFEGVLALGQQIANAAVAGGGLSEVMRIMISNGIILYALTQSGGGSRE